MTPDENRCLGSIEATLKIVHDDVKRIVPLVDAHGEAIEGLKKSQAWIKRIMLSVLTMCGLGGVVAKLWPSGG